jgi:hypothetical protein
MARYRESPHKGYASAEKHPFNEDPVMARPACIGLKPLFFSQDYLEHVIRFAKRGIYIFICAILHV